MNTHSITKLDTHWQELLGYARRHNQVRVADLFDDEPARVKQFSIRVGNMLLDASKNVVSAEALGLLYQLARAARLEAKRDGEAQGESAIGANCASVDLRLAVRGATNRAVMVDNTDVTPPLIEERERLFALCEQIISGERTSATGEKYTDVINIATGVASAGVELVTEALSPYCNGLRVHTLSNIDGQEAGDILGNLNPATTLVVISTRVFGTIEMVRNARSVRDWMAFSLGKEAANHNMLAVTLSPHMARSFDIPSANVLTFPNWMPESFALWNAKGIGACLALGVKNYKALLAGAAEMDNHYARANLERNMPVLLALIGMWHRNALGYSSLAICPYDYRLSKLIDYVSCLEARCNGKSVHADGGDARTATAPAVWGRTGTDAQHSIMQTIHQGTEITPVDFIVGCRPTWKENTAIAAEQNHHRHLVANCLTQSKYLMSGNIAEASKGRSGGGAQSCDRQAMMRGSRPSNTIMFRQLDPHTLGSLIALYEHKTDVESIIWNVNGFSEYGCQTGAGFAQDLANKMRDNQTPDNLDASTSALLSTWKEWRAESSGSSGA